MLAEGAFHQHLEALKAEYERLVAENEQLRRAPSAPDSPPQPRTEPLAVPPPLEPPPFAAPALLGAETAGAEGAKSWSQALQDEVAVTKALGLNERPLGLVALEAMAILVTCGALLLGGWLTKEGYRSAAEWGLEITFTVFFVFEGILRCYYAEREDSWWGSQLNGMNYAGGLVSLFNAGRGSWSAWLLVIRALRLRRFKLARQLKKWMGGGREAEFLWLTADFFLFLYLLAIIVTKYYTNLSVEEMLDVGAGMFLAFRCFMGDFHNVGPAKLDQEDVLFWVPFLVILIPTVLLGVGCIARVIVALCMPDAKDQSIGVKKLLAMMSQVCVKLNIDVPALP